MGICPTRWDFGELKSKRPGSFIRELKVFVLSMNFHYFDADFTLKTGLKWKNDDTFTNKTFWVQGMKVPLFLGFGDILMLKIKSQKAEL